MLPKFKTKPLYMGYTISQFIILSLLLLFTMFIFAIVSSGFGILPALGVAVLIFGGPACFFFMANYSMNILLVEWFYFHFLKPKIYLP
jgi:hypothetical protein